ITRDSVIKIAKEAGIPVVETPIPREWLYISDELFFTGTAAEITPIASVDRIPVGEGKRGPVTKKIQDTLFGILNGETKDRFNWLTPVQ
ncbi:MAG: branched chain amino acid aminotransferase, partial [Acidobacteria bacterium]